MSAIYESNNFEPFARYHRGPQQPPYYTRPPAAAAAAPRGYAAPAAFSFSHHPPAPSFDEYSSHTSYPSTTYYDAAPAPAAPIPVLAERYKTKYCKNYLQTHHCPYEERCMFAHGEEELRTVHDNVRDGLVTEEAIKSFQRQWRQAILYGEATAVPNREETVHAPYPHHTYPLPVHMAAEDEDGASSTATVPKLVQPFLSSSEIMVPVKEYLSKHTYRYNPYGTVSVSAPMANCGFGGSRCSSMDNCSSIAGDDDDCYCYDEESTPQKRPML